MTRDSLGFKLPAVQSIASPTGGGWVIPLTPEGADILFGYYGEPPQPLEPLGGKEGYIVEPYDAPEIVNRLCEADETWTVG